VEIRIDVDLTQVHKAYQKRISRLKTKKQFVLSQVKPIVERELLLNLRTEGRPAPGRRRWEDLSESRQRQRALHGLGAKHPMLIGETGELSGNLSKVRITFRGDDAHIKPDISGKGLTKLSELHFGLPPAEVDVFGMTKGNVGQKAEGTSKAGKSYQFRLPTRPVFFISKQAWREIIRRGRKWFLEM